MTASTFHPAGAVHAGVEQASHDLNVSVLWNGAADETDYTRQIRIVDAMVARRHGCSPRS
ncbi:MAG TPA: hypothetical protein VN924_15705 [Bryobacteraceae bacterium]|jgi:hypothetical protein|nr:hypothetical protein [Bryobacteraceae bacterium]